MKFRVTVHYLVPLLGLVARRFAGRCGIRIAKRCTNLRFWIRRFGWPDGEVSGRRSYYTAFSLADHSIFLLRRIQNIDCLFRWIFVSFSLFSGVSSSLGEVSDVRIWTSGREDAAKSA